MGDNIDGSAIEQHNRASRNRQVQGDIGEA